MNIFKRQLKEVIYGSRKPETIKCYFCKHLVEKDDCKTVKASSSTRYGGTDKYYCNLHILKYDYLVPYFDGDNRYYNIIPEKYIEVTEDGKVIKKKK